MQIVRTSYEVVDSLGFPLGCKDCLPRSSLIGSPSQLGYFGDIGVSCSVGEDIIGRDETDLDHRGHKTVILPNTTVKYKGESRLFDAYAHNHTLCTGIRRFNLARKLQVSLLVQS